MQSCSGEFEGILVHPISCVMDGERSAGVPVMELRSAAGFMCAGFGDGCTGITVRPCMTSRGAQYRSRLPRCLLRSHILDETRDNRNANNDAAALIFFHFFIFFVFVGCSKSDFLWASISLRFLLTVSYVKN